MKCLQAIASLMLLCTALAMGCSQETKKTTTSTVDTPGGSTTVQTDTTIKKTGDHRTDKPNNNPVTPP